MAKLLEPEAALRVGVLGDATAEDGTQVVAALDRLRALVSQERPALLRLLCQDATPGETAIRRAAEQAGWAAHRVAGLPIAADPAHTLVLDGSAAEPAAAASMAAEIILRNCDVLIGLGDAGCGTLERHVDQALGLGIPVLWLAPGQPGRLLLERGWSLAREKPPEGEAALAGLQRRVAAMLQPPPAPPSDAFQILTEPALPRGGIWRTHRTAMELLSRSPGGTSASGQLSQYWAELYDPADALASAFADRYRSSYTLVLLLAAAALIAAVLGLAAPDAEYPLLTAVPELASLLGIVLIVAANARFDWRSQLIVYRLLAELCRKQAALACVGRSLPASRVAGLTQEGDLGWVGWRFAAAVRGAPLLRGVLAGDTLAAARDAAAAVLLQGQRAYHATRAAANRRREQRLVTAGLVAFWATFGCVVVKVALLSGHWRYAEAFGLVAALLPAGAAALFGLRAYAELELLVAQSERMIAVVDAAASSLARTDTGRPRASAFIGDVLEETAAAMLADVEGWIQVSRVKAVEPG